MDIHIHHHADEQMAEAICMLRKILRNQEIIMGRLEEANASLDKIDEATTEQGQVLEEDSATLQEISDDMDKLIAQAGTSVPAQVLERLQASADRAALVSTSLKAHAAFSKSVAAKHEDPVPIPVPEPTPEA